MNRIFTLFMLGILCLAFKESNAQTVSLGFNKGAEVHATDACWTNNNFSFNNTGKDNNGDGTGTIMTKDITADFITPFIDIPAKGTIQIDYRASDISISHELTVSLISLTTSTTLGKISVTNTSAFTTSSYTVPTAGTYRIGIAYKGGANKKDNKIYVEIDNLVISGAFHYSNPCNMAPIAVDDIYAPNPITALTVTGNVLANDSDPNHTADPSLALRGEPLSVVSNTNPPEGTLTLNTDGTFSFTPNASFTGGPVTFTYTVTDNGYSPLTATATVTINYPDLIPTPLPIKLLSFTGQLVNDKAQLNWSVDDNETGNYFKVERSTDGRNFSEVALLYANGKSGKQDYSYTEPLASPVSTYYRLKIVNHDGPPAYSKTVLIKPQLSTATTSALNILSRPESPTLRVAFSASQPEPSTVSIYTLNGTRVSTQQLTTAKGLNYLELETSTLPKGVYLLEVNSPTTSRRTKFLK